MDTKPRGTEKEGGGDERGWGSVYRTRLHFWALGCYFGLIYLIMVWEIDCKFEWRQIPAIQLSQKMG